ncbi:MAG: hypothetical protein HXS52_04725 [Theionarchaea archaeon]|nr:hypothetical protein [Theionarchaea archaeon]MBU7037210.1 hypothetical protein [Theionarchaea archaeon]
MMAIVRPPRTCRGVLRELVKTMRGRHPRIASRHYGEILITIGSLTFGGSTTTVSEVTAELRSMGLCSVLSDGQIRSRIKDLKAESYMTMEYRGPRLLFVHQAKGVIRSWSVLLEVFKDLEGCLAKHPTALNTVTPELAQLRAARTHGDFIGSIRVYNRIVMRIGFMVNCAVYFIEMRGVAKRIEMTIKGWKVYFCRS